jgi:hypothetical protein
MGVQDQSIVQAMVVVSFDCFDHFNMEQMMRQSAKSLSNNLLAGSRNQVPQAKSVVTERKRQISSHHHVRFILTGDKTGHALIFSHR